MTNSEMMKKLLPLCAATVALLFCVALANVAEAGTIIKLSLGNDPGPDVAFNGTVFSTIDDTLLATPLGDQKTAVEFLDFLGFIPPIPPSAASYTLSGVTVGGSAASVLGTVVQPLVGGSFSLWDPSDALLLSADLGGSTLTGTLGPPGTGAVFSTTLGTVTGGSLATLIDPNSISIAIEMTTINGGAGLSVTPGPGGDELDPFVADVTEGIAADQRNIPEPASAMLLILGGALLLSVRRRS